MASHYKTPGTPPNRVLPGGVMGMPAPMAPLGGAGVTAKYFPGPGGPPNFSPTGMGFQRPPGIINVQVTKFFRLGLEVAMFKC